MLILHGRQLLPKRVPYTSITQTKPGSITSRVPPCILKHFRILMTVFLRIFIHGWKWQDEAFVAGGESRD